MLNEIVSELVQKYGFKGVYEELMAVSKSLVEKYKAEIQFIETLGNTKSENHDDTNTKEIQITGPVAQEATEKGEGKEIPIVEMKSRKMKVIRRNGKFIKVDETSVETSITNEYTQVVVQKEEEENTNTEDANTPAKRTPKEIKKWQREQESARRKYMRENQITLKSVLDENVIREHLKSGKTYAWIAREITGQKEEEVSKWCKERGLRKGEGV